MYTNIQNTILQRYKKNARDLPRRKTTDPYHILVSEIMLQQTQVDRVIPKYIAFLKKFPSCKVLAQASKQDLLSMRSGLWYNTRALNLQKAAQKIIQEYNDHIPTTKEALVKLPWIWPYTAGAICAFSCNQDVSVIDINIKRVLIHLLKLDPNIPAKELEQIVYDILPKGKSRIRYNALMDYGALVLTSKKTGIKSPKQSTFQGSARQVRWNIIKHITKNGKLSIAEAQELYPHEDFEKIIQKMQQQNIIHIYKDNISLE